MQADKVVGVDGCRCGWIAASYSPQSSSFSFSLHQSFAALLDEHRSAISIGVDIPIGLSESFTPRNCDRRARELIGPRRSSVFPAPDRRILKLAPYAAANTFAREECDKGISQQCFHIMPKIAEVDGIMTSKVQARIFEVHPEVCFWAASGRVTLMHSKRTLEGYEERCSILRKAFPHANFAALPGKRPEIVWQTLHVTSREVQPDDILDAMIAAWTALRHSRNEHSRIPDTAEYDPRGLRMEIVF